MICSTYLTYLITYQYGIVCDVEHDRDGRVRKANVRYQNANESCPRETARSVRSLVVIHRVDELYISRELFALDGNFCYTFFTTLKLF